MMAAAPSATATPNNASRSPASLRMLHPLLSFLLGTFDRIELPRQPDCQACGQRHFEYLDAPADAMGATLCGRNAVQVRPAATESGTLDLDTLAERLRPVGEVVTNGFLLRLRVDGYEVTLFPDARAIIKGTDDPAVARSVYARYIGA